MNLEGELLLPHRVERLYRRNVVRACVRMRQADYVSLDQHSYVTPSRVRRGRALYLTVEDNFLSASLSTQYGSLVPKD
jgi:hypothetical protein